MERLVRRLTAWKIAVVEIGIFILFVITFGEFLLKKLWSVVAPLFQTLAY